MIAKGLGILGISFICFSITGNEFFGLAITGSDRLVLIIIILDILGPKYNHHHVLC